MKKGYTLIQAIMLIEANEHDKLTMIQYEDGSGYKFNYTLGTDPTPKFADLTPQSEIEKAKASVVQNIILKF